MSVNNQLIETLRKFECTDDKKSMGILVFTILLQMALVTLSAFSYTVHPWLPALFWIPIGVMFCRFFVLEHDCGHYSFFTSRSRNRIASKILGFFCLIPSSLWNFIHDTHHGMLGNLGLRSENPELWTMTVEEFKKAKMPKQIAYRFVRSKFMRLVVTPFLWMIAPRIPFPQLGWKICAAIIWQDLVYGTVLFFLIKNDLFFAFVVVILVPYYLFNVLASIVFYLQHQFEDTFWDTQSNWNLHEASIKGSSHLVFGKFMSWVTGNVGCHHVHHLNTKIPSYCLFEATEEANKVLSVSPIYIKNMFRHFNAVLWDEASKKLISFSAYRKIK